MNDSERADKGADNCAASLQGASVTAIVRCGDDAAVPAGYRLVERIELLDDPLAADWMIKATLSVFIVGLCSSLFWVAGEHPTEPLGLVWFTAVIVASIGALPLHELVHAAFFRLLGGRGVSVDFGYRDGCLYASVPGLVLSRVRFLVVLLAPTVLLSALFLAGGAYIDWGFAGYCCFWLHLSGCVGDLYLAKEIWKRKEARFVMDTDAGVDLLARKEG